MKKFLPIFLIAVLFIGGLSACAGAGGSSTADALTDQNSAAFDENSIADEAYGETNVVENIAGNVGKTTNFTEKIIYSAYAEMETVEFDETISAIYEMLDSYGAFIENSYISGKNYESHYYGYKTYRNAEFTLRVPVASFEEVKTELAGAGNITSLSSNAENITTQFLDTESRLATYRTEEERLLAMLESAETVSDMIEIESRLSEVRYEIESLTTMLNNWQNQVDYSTITISIYEVEKLSESVSAQRSYWQEIGDGIMSTLEGIGEFFKGLFKGFVIFLPVLILLALLAAAVLVTIVALRKKKAKKGIIEKREGNDKE